MFGKLSHVIASAGIGSLPWRGYSYAYKNIVRPFIPNARPVLYNGVKIGRYRKYGDRLVEHVYMPPDIADQPDYEEALVKALESSVEPGDRVVVVGGGLGITVVVAARSVGPTGTVVCFEGDRDGVCSVHEAVRLNGVNGRVSVVHAIVGDNIGVYGNEFASIAVAPGGLPDCDVLELDCEGSEVGILQALVIRPRVIMVETHGFMGASTAATRDLLIGLGYVVRDLGWAENRRADDCRRYDIRVLLGTRID